VSWRPSTERLGPATPWRFSIPDRIGAQPRRSSSGTVLDLACGREGYGLEIAARTGARVGVDFSAEAVRQAREHGQLLGRTADFRIGDLASTGLGAGSADAVLCVDHPVRPAARGRLLRAVAGACTWRTCGADLLGAIGQDDELLPDRLRRVTLGARLTAAGFSDVEVRDRPGWRARERAMWQQAAALDPGADSALRSSTTKTCAPSKSST
jgi:hypothetical protein